VRLWSKLTLSVFLKSRLCFSIKTVAILPG
jgi:hypothetical protein